VELRVPFKVPPQMEERICRLDPIFPICAFVHFLMSEMTSE
jgi:hypothetical protein